MSGVVAPNLTAFPTSIGLAATWDPAAVEEMADIIRRQMRAVGLLQALAPVMDVARDARWGRVSETYGEDPYLVAAMSVAYTRGLQGNDLTAGVLATAKHFLGYAVTEGGQNMAATAVGPRELYDVHARPFAAAIRLANLATIMPSYSEFDCVPISASHAILTEMLRNKMGFTGTTVSDYVAVGFLQSRQRVAESAEQAGTLALAAGMDVETPAVFGYRDVLAKAVRSGKVSESLLDQAAGRVLRGDGEAVHVSPLTVMKVVVGSVLLPLGAGFAIGRWRPAATRWAPAIQKASGLVLLACVVPIVVGAWPLMASLVREGTLTAIVAITLIGLAVGHVLGGPHEDDRTVLAFATVSRHPGVAVAVATLTDQPLAPIGVLLAVLVSELAVIPYKLWRKRLRAAPRAAGHGPPAAGVH